MESVKNKINETWDFMGKIILDSMKMNGAKTATVIHESTPTIETIKITRNKDDTFEAGRF